MVTNVFKANQVVATINNHNNNNNWKAEKVKTESFHDIIKNLIFLSQFFGIMPVSGILGPISSLSFNLFSFRVVYLFLIFIGMAFLFVFRVIEFISHGITFYRSTAPFFILFSIIANLTTINMARLWPQLMQNWCSTENKLQLYSSNSNLKARIYIAFVIFGVCGTIEHLLSLVATTIVSQECQTSGGRFQAFYEVLFSQIFKRIPYSTLIALIAQYAEIANIFIWNFRDLLIIVMSLGLADLFKRITCHMQQLQLKKTTENVWREIREDYNQVVNLCYHLNKTISGFVFLSFANNVYFICAQMLHSIKAPKNAIEIVYFYFCMTYMFSRTFLVTLIASRINEESRAPLKILFNVPSHSFCGEITRFIQQISLQTATLTGLNFFSVRRGIILTVASTIVTYELVLVQFSTETEILQSQSNNTRNTTCLQLGKL